MTFILVIYDLKTIAETKTAVNLHDYVGTAIAANTYNTELHNKVKTAMYAKGYSSTAHTTKSHLPHNCLVKDNTSQQQALADLIEVVKKHNAALESYIVVTVAGSYQADASVL